MMKIGIVAQSSKEERQCIGLSGDASGYIWVGTRGFSDKGGLETRRGFDKNREEWKLKRLKGDFAESGT